MAEEKAVAEKPSEEKKLTFRIKRQLLAGEHSFAPGDEDKLLEQKNKLVKEIAYWLRNGDIVGEVPGIRLDVNQSQNLPRARNR